MKQSVKSILLLAMVALMLGACNNDSITPSSNITTQERAVSAFDGLEVSTAFQVDVEFTSGEERVEIEANENLQSHIQADKNGSRLRIKIIDGTSVSGNATLKAHILTPNPMKYLSGDGASLITLKNTNNAVDMQMSLSDASLLTGTIIAEDLSINLSGASNVTLAGVAGAINANADGASIISGFDMICENLDMKLSGACTASLTVNGTINFTASGASSLMYKGSATLGQIDTSDTSSITKVN
jgi:hypothetical protein